MDTFYLMANLSFPSPQHRALEQGHLVQQSAVINIESLGDRHRISNICQEPQVTSGSVPARLVVNTKQNTMW